MAIISRVFSSRVARVTTVLLILGSTSACSEYWWSRGQASTVPQLIERNQAKLATARSERAEFRNEVAVISEPIEKDLLAAQDLLVRNSSQDQLAVHLRAAGESFMKLEGKLSIGSRAAFGELTGQLRGFQQGLSQGHPPTADAFGLFTARTLGFLASELSVPAPNFG